MVFELPHCNCRLASLCEQDEAKAHFMWGGGQALSSRPQPLLGSCSHDVTLWLMCTEFFFLELSLGSDGYVCTASYIVDFGGHVRSTDSYNFVF